MYSKFLKVGVFGISFLLSALFFIPFSYAGKGCNWKDGGWFLECKSGYWGMGTGCIGLKNISGEKIRVKVNGDNKLNVKKRFNKGKHRKADFKGTMTVHTCQKKDSNGKWKKVKCYDVFDRTKNNDSGGGCGCKVFNCLPGW